MCESALQDFPAGFEQHREKTDFFSFAVKYQENYCLISLLSVLQYMHLIYITKYTYAIVDL